MYPKCIETEKLRIIIYNNPDNPGFPSRLYRQRQYSKFETDLSGFSYALMKKDNLVNCKMK